MPLINVHTTVDQQQGLTAVEDVILDKRHNLTAVKAVVTSFMDIRQELTLVDVAVQIIMPRYIFASPSR